MCRNACFYVFTVLFQGHGESEVNSIQPTVSPTIYHAGSRKFQKLRARLVEGCGLGLEPSMLSPVSGAVNLTNHDHELV